MAKKTVTNVEEEITIQVKTKKLTIKTLQKTIKKQFQSQYLCTLIYIPYWNTLLTGQSAAEVATKVTMAVTIMVVAAVAVGA
jgi:hypothetical protein